MVMVPTYVCWLPGHIPAGASRDCGCPPPCLLGIDGIADIEGGG